MKCKYLNREYYIYIRFGERKKKEYERAESEKEEGTIKTLF